MNIRRKNKTHAAVEAGALSDILFFLMLFFLIISTLASPSAIKLLLPKASTGKTVPRQVIMLSLKADRSCYIGSKPVEISALQSALQQEAATKENPTVVLRVDKTLDVETMVSVVDQVNKAKLPLVLATDKGK